MQPFLNELLRKNATDPTAGCPIAYVALAQIALGCANPLTPTAPTAPSPSPAAQGHILDGLLFSLDWLLEGIEAQQAAAGHPAGTAGGTQGGAQHGSLSSLDYLWAAVNYGFVCLASPRLKGGIQTLVRTGEHAKLLAPAAAVLRLLAGPGISMANRSMATLQACELLDTALKHLDSSTEAGPATAQQGRDAVSAVVCIVPSAAAALRLLEKAAVECGATSADPGAPDALMNLALGVQQLSFALISASAAPTACSPADARSWCLAGALGCWICVLGCCGALARTLPAACRVRAFPKRALRCRAVGSGLASESCANLVSCY